MRGPRTTAAAARWAGPRAWESSQQCLVGHSTKGSTSPFLASCLLNACKACAGGRASSPAVQNQPPCRAPPPNRPRLPNRCPCPPTPVTDPFPLLPRCRSGPNGQLTRTRSGLGVPKRTPELAAQLEDQILEWAGDKPIHRWVGTLPSFACTAPLLPHSLLSSEGGARRAAQRVHPRRACCHGCRCVAVPPPVPPLSVARIKSTPLPTLPSPTPVPLLPFPCCSVLVANNGLAAVKFIRSVRSWAYKNFGNERAGGWVGGWDNSGWRGGGAGWGGCLQHLWQRARGWVGWRVVVVGCMVGGVAG